MLSFYDDQGTHHAAALTYYALMSLFPTLLLAVSLLGLSGEYPDTYNAIVSHLRGRAPGDLLLIKLAASIEAEIICDRRVGDRRDFRRCRIMNLQGFEPAPVKGQVIGRAARSDDAPAQAKGEVGGKAGARKLGDVGVEKAIR